MKENVIQINDRITKNADALVKKSHICEKSYIWNPATCSCENRKYLASIMDDSVITCDEVIESYNRDTKIFRTNFDKKMQPVKQKITLFYLPFY